MVRSSLPTEQCINPLLAAPNEGLGEELGAEPWLGMEGTGPAWVGQEKCRGTAGWPAEIDALTHALHSP